MVSRTPDYVVAALNKHDNRKNGNVGRAWKNDDGSIAVVLDSFIVIEGGRDMLLTLFPYDESRRRKDI